MTGIVAAKHLLGAINPDAASAWAKLVSWWPLTEASGTRADVHGSNDLDVIASPSELDVTTGHPGSGSAIQFENATASISRAGADCTGLDDQDTYEILTWVKSGDIAGDLWTVVSKCPQANPRARGYALYIGRNDTDPNKARHLKGISIDDPVIEPITVDTWFLFSAYRNGTDRGIALNAGAETVTETGTSTSNDTADPFWIGPRIDSEEANFVYVGQTAFFSDVLTDDERTYLYNFGAGVTYAKFRADAGG